MRIARKSRSGPERGAAARALGVSALVIFFVVMLAAIAVFTFSVKVYGHSMDPTLGDGDRLLTNILGRSHVDRFDLVQTRAGVGGIEVVKRVIGMPGDKVGIRGGDHPEVYVVPAGQTQKYVVDNPTWPSRINGRTQGCCTANGKATHGDAIHWLTLAPKTYWLLGDNWGGSDDSRVWGTVTDDLIGSTLNWRLTPLSRFGKISSQARLVPAS